MTSEAKHTPNPKEHLEIWPGHTVSRGRLRACVNACAGIPTEQLEAGCIKELVEAAEKITAVRLPERDSLAWREVVSTMKGLARAALGPFEKE